jgi:hypothetical protein
MPSSHPRSTFKPGVEDWCLVQDAVFKFYAGKSAVLIKFARKNAQVKCRARIGVGHGPFVFSGSEAKAVFAVLAAGAGLIRYFDVQEFLAHRMHRRVIENGCNAFQPVDLALNARCCGKVA